MSPLKSFEIDYTNGLPVWIQLRNRISYLIGTGEYSTGEQLPTVRALAIDLNISYNTVNRVYMDLEREGFITSRKGRGTFVAQQRETSLPASDSVAEVLADEMIRTAANAGMSEGDILNMVQARMAHKKSANNPR